MEVRMTILDPINILSTFVKDIIQTRLMRYSKYSERAQYICAYHKELIKYTSTLRQKNINFYNKE